jgi:DNA/RNA-binding domain of Phe-tRNA-synthetase-like protein
MVCSISEDFRKKGTSLRLGILDFNSKITKANAKLWETIDAVSRETCNSLSLDKVNKIKNIASTRDGYKKCGKDPNRYRPSADSLIRRLVKGNPLYRINNVVDVLNLISVQTGFSIGGYDRDKIKGDIVMDIGRANDHYIGIGRGELNIEGMPVLRDDIDVFGSPTSDSERTMIDNSSTSIRFIFFDFSGNSPLDDIFAQTISFLEQFTESKSFKTEIIGQ